MKHLSKSKVMGEEPFNFEEIKEAEDDLRHKVISRNSVLKANNKGPFKEGEGNVPVEEDGNEALMP
eukprot:CAMPEP_0170555796 /NCGR_PEP_ID=MMETSP0211-20121228/13610_1 /TAXON_ID=311385 /ORGANISM="Pseudokeronopsis sp., Strain OXSARD2" /LENGTH=65 /DNA_ID=CAMNT_0010865785 /DNA_START=769 /DNA_END=966 /DNA_ORIENTATION=-